MQKITIREVGLMGFENIVCKENHLRFRLKKDCNRIYLERINEKWFTYSLTITDFLLSAYLSENDKNKLTPIKEIDSIAEIKKIVKVLVDN